MTSSINIAIESNEFAKIKRGSQLIAESIHRIINTLPGERPGNPTFGCEIRRINFDQNDFLTQRAGEFFIRQAIMRHEPRVELTNVTFLANYNTHVLEIKLFFRIKEEHKQLYTMTEVIPI